jgi:hypothetical protein
VLYLIQTTESERTILLVVFFGYELQSRLNLLVRYLMLADDVLEERQRLGTQGVTVFPKDLR